MGWLTLLSALLPLIMQIIKLFQNIDPSKMTARQKEKAGQFKTACRQFDSVTDSLGVSAVALPSMAEEE